MVDFCRHFHCLLHPSAQLMEAQLLLVLLLLAATVLPAVADSNRNGDGDDDRCLTFDECCDWYGPNSKRCLRGPCSHNFIVYKFFSMSMPTKDVGFWDVVFIFYNMVPYLALIAILLDLLFHKRALTRIIALLLLILFTVINTNILVNIIGDCSECERPAGSCLKSGGMPSGHATNAIGLGTWIVLVALFGVRRKIWSVWRKIVVIVLCILLFVPVPISRVYLGDHTILQVIVGSIDGVILGTLYYLLWRTSIMKRASLAFIAFADRRLHLTIKDDFYNTTALAGAMEMPLVDAESSANNKDDYHTSSSNGDNPDVMNAV